MAIMTFYPQEFDMVLFDQRKQPLPKMNILSPNPAGLHEYFRTTVEQPRNLPPSFHKLRNELNFTTIDGCVFASACIVAMQGQTDRIHFDFLAFCKYRALGQRE